MVLSLRYRADGISFAEAHSHRSEQRNAGDFLDYFLSFSQLQDIHYEECVGLAPASPQVRAALLLRAARGDQPLTEMAKTSILRFF
jgi:hypothetical protein